MTLVSLHLPKTAGTSLRQAISDHFGKDLYEDYGNPPMQMRRGPRELQALVSGLAARFKAQNAPRAVHGHFMPLKYRLALPASETRYVTWLRDPVERALSHFHFWKRDYVGDDPAQPLRNRMLREDWSLERFCLGPEMRDVYAQYLWGFAPEWFEFIGITEHYDADLAEFTARYLPGQAAADPMLVNPERPGAWYEIDPMLRERIERHHARDMALYRWACASRTKRIGLVAPGGSSQPAHRQG